MLCPAKHLSSVGEIETVNEVFGTPVGFSSRSYSLSTSLKESNLNLGYVIQASDERVDCCQAAHALEYCVATFMPRRIENNNHSHHAINE